MSIMCKYGECDLVNFKWEKDRLKFIVTEIKDLHQRIKIDSTEATLLQGKYFNIFCMIFTELRKRTPELREGQALMITLNLFRKELYDKYSGTEFDCFYKDDRIKGILKKLRKELVIE